MFFDSALCVNTATKDSFFYGLLMLYEENVCLRHVQIDILQHLM